MNQVGKQKREAKGMGCKAFFSFFLAFLIWMAPSQGALAKEAAGWYVKRNGEHKQPALDQAQEYIEKYDGFYIDKKHGDESAEKVLYLTFDAGYENGNIALILDALQKENVPAAFFVLKHLIKEEPELIRRMEKEGHLVCNHTVHHKDMTKVDRKVFVEELEGLATLYEELIGKKMPKYYRPPEGKYNEANMQWAKELGYKTIFWSFAYADWDNGRQMEIARAKKKIKDNMHNGAVLLLHPTSKTNALLLPELIREWKAEGYRFGTLDELTEK